ncbi:DUF4180 domain-containing protein [Coprothermobacter platensis]|uniref:DUF4180 domain-containing protein n=1 Tax=Coprothermobacter platensis TaxID=108819 RepID=UPI000366C164|nr:DUF4180 domain-containing protein [Coprothermobacter platensis]
MDTHVVEKNGMRIAVVKSNNMIISDEQSVVDFIAKVLEETGCDRIIVSKDIVPEEFFDLSTRLAGSILQKFVNYNVKIAFVGDFSSYPSKSLRDFIYESNNGNDVFFVQTEEEAFNKLKAV